MAEISDIKYMKKHLQDEELKHVYLFYGPENYLKDLYTERIKKRLNADSMNTFIFSSGADVNEIDSICSSVSMFGDLKLIIINGSGLFKSSADISFVDKAEAGDTYIVFKEDEVDKRSKLYKKLCESSIVFNAKKQPLSEIKKVLSHTVKASGRTVSEYVLQYMIEGIGDDISKLLLETEKLILYVSAGEEIKKEHIDALCILHSSPKVFDLNDAVACGNTDKAYIILKGLLEDKEPPVKIMAIISKMWSQLYNAKLLSSEGIKISEIASLLGIKEFAAGKLVKQASDMTAEYIKKKIDLCEELDFAVKSGQIKDITAVQLLTV